MQNCTKKWKNYPFNCKKWKNLQLLIIQGSLDLNITFLGEKLLETQNLLVLYKGKKSKNTNKKRKHENFEKRNKYVSFSCPKNLSTHKLGSQVKRCAQ